MTNLFRQWDGNCLAVACQNIESPDLNICDNYYCLGSLEFCHNFPFNLNEKWKPEVFSGVLPKITDTHNDCGIRRLPHSGRFRSGYESLIRTFGLNHYKRRMVISGDLLKWIQEFSPDFIYSQLSDLESILFVERLHDELKIPIAIHIMDDWPRTIGREGVLKSYWHKKILKSFKRLLSKTSVFLSISEAMSEEYYSRYGYRFTHFHNPIDLDFWGRESKTCYECKEPFTILYAGRIGRGISDSLKDIAQAVDNLVVRGVKIEMHIQATIYNPILDDLSKFKSVKLDPTVTIDRLPGIFSNSDLLLIPIDFDEDSIQFLKFSMLTKASEYMVSGTPILLYASSETAIAKHASKHKWAYVVTDNKTEVIENAIMELYSNSELRSRLGTTAKRYAEEHYEGKKVQEEFRKAFILN